MDYLREQLEQLFLKLPSDLKAALFSEINAVFIRQTAEKFKIPEEKISALANQVGLVILGVLPPQNLAGEIKMTLNVDDAIALAVARDINFKVFTPIRISLRQLYGLATPEEIRLEPMAITPPPARPAPLPPRPTPWPSPLPRPIAPMPAPVAPKPAAPPPPPTTLPTMPAPWPTAPLPVRPPFPPVAPTPIPPISAWPAPPLPGLPRQRESMAGQPRPFIPPRPIRPPGVIVPQTITYPASQRPAYESPALSLKPLPPMPTAPIQPPAGAKMPAPAGQIAGGPAPIPPKPAVEPMIAPKPAILPPTEPIDLTKLNANDPRLEGNVVDLKNLE